MLPLVHLLSSADLSVLLAVKLLSPTQHMYPDINIHIHSTQYMRICTHKHIHSSVGVQIVCGQENRHSLGDVQ
jgi:hypothetical protein